MTASTTGGPLRPVDRFGRIGGRGVHWLAWPSGGSGQSRPTVLLHGLMDCARMWTGTARRLWPACACVAPDLRGHGRSDAVAGDGSQYLVWALAEDLGAFLDHLALPRVDMVAYSLGARAAMAFARDHADRIDRLVLIDMGPEMARAGARGVRKSTGTAAGGPSSSDGAAPRPAEAPPPGFASLDEALEALAPQFPTFDVPDRLALLHDAYVRRPGAPGGERIVPGFDPALVAITGDLALQEIPFLWESLPHIPCPTLVVRGERSRVLSAEIAARMLAALPDAREAVIADAGHRLVNRNAAAFEDAVAGFLARPSGAD